MNFYDSLNNRKSSIAEDAAPNNGKTRYIIDCRDYDRNILNLIRMIKKNGNGGHSFNIVVDPDSNGKSDMTIFWDGDGSDRINSIVEVEKGDDLVGLLLANINTIRAIAKGAIPDPDFPSVKPDNPMTALKTISVTCDTLLDGNLRDRLDTAQEVCELILQQCNYKSSNPNWTDKDTIDHIREICEGHLEMIRKETKE